MDFGFARGRCSDCGHELLLPFSCKARGFVHPALRNESAFLVSSC
jgi:hypothetical protein